MIYLTFVQTTAHGYEPQLHGITDWLLSTIADDVTPFAVSGGTTQLDRSACHAARVVGRSKIWACYKLHVLANSTRPIETIAQ